MVDATLVGVDGCRAGWIAASRVHPKGPVEIRCFANFQVLVAAFDETAIVVVDMPIGLPERIEGAGRSAERAARKNLRARRPSVFSIPARAVLEAHPLVFEDEAHRRAAHAQASTAARALSDPPKGVSIQGFSLFPKILEIDRLLRASKGLAERVFESHPEMAFRAMNGGWPCEHAKKLRGRANPAGLEERAALLRASGIPASATERAPKGAGRDDLLDALSMLVVAARLQAGTAIAHPDPPDRDAHGLPIAIWA